MILGTARTGSTMLWSYLNSHPEILCMRGVYGSRHKINFGKFHGELPEEAKSNELIEMRNERPIEFLERFVWKKFSKPYRAIGFKYFYDHNRHTSNKNELVDYFQANRSIKFLHLKRENLLASLFSYKQAVAEQNWGRSDTDFRTALSVNECGDYFQSIICFQHFFDTLFADRMLQVEYEKLSDSTQETLQGILMFLGVDKAVLTTEISKNKKSDLSECISNYLELKDRFKNTDFEKYFNF